MDRHWRELTTQLRAGHFGRLNVSSPFGLSSHQSCRAGRARRAWNKYFWYPLKVRFARRSDITHVLDHSFAHFLRHVPRSTRKVVTVHDLAPLEDPSQLTPAQVRRYRRCVEWLNTADVLLPVSEYSAKSLRAFLKTAPRIEVLPMGVDVETFSRPADPAVSIALPSCPRVLSIGSCLKRKNLDVLPDVLSRVVQAVGPVALIRVGELLPTGLRRRVEEVLPPGHLVELGSLPDARLVAVYQSVQVMLLPSLVEGFGLPVVEAMAAGCPVVCSRASSLPEVGGDAVLYFDPADAAEAAGQLTRILKDDSLRARLVQKGRERARNFSWANHAARLAAVYQSLLADAPR